MEASIYSFSGQNVRTIKLENGDPLFCLSDVGDILGLTNAYRQAKEFSKGVHTVTTLTKGGSQDIIFIDEPNLYRLIFKSRKEIAKKFQDWIFEQVIPSIRKNGSYGIPSNAREQSVKNRKQITDAWHKSGIKDGHEFAELTVSEYNALKFEPGKRKRHMNNEEILLLSALESLETLNLYYNPKNGVIECKESLFKTAEKVKSIEQPSNNFSPKMVNK